MSSSRDALMLVIITLLMFGCASSREGDSIHEIKDRAGVKGDSAFFIIDAMSLNEADVSPYGISHNARIIVGGIVPELRFQFTDELPLDSDHKFDARIYLSKGHNILLVNRYRGAMAFRLRITGGITADSGWHLIDNGETGMIIGEGIVLKKLVVADAALQSHDPEP